HQWQLGTGMRDLLVDGLINTNRYTVLTRRDIASVLAEQEIQQNDAFRDQGKVKQGNLKNIQYLIKGAVTDFAHVGGGTLRVLGSKLGIVGDGQVALVSVTLYVIDVETGEIVASKTLEGKASAGSVDFKAQYKGIGFGGNAFYRTPLGKATQEVINNGLVVIGETIANKQWYPSVIKVEEERLFLSGGFDRKIEVGSEWGAYSPGEVLIDPATGDVLGQKVGTLSGEIIVGEVFDRYSVAEVREGAFRRGQRLRPIQQNVKKENISGQHFPEDSIDTSSHLNIH
uniref:CsgG/HfaB family protein n=1 Tax=Malonomonas rubra TaxID=57040 RepID=UPI0026EF977E